MSSAFFIKVRTGQITLDQSAAGLAMFRKPVTESLTVLPVTGQYSRAAAQHADHHALGLRAGDALHLAIAFEAGAILQTLDRKLTDAGPALGITTNQLA